MTVDHDAHPALAATTVFAAGTDGYHTFRIPAIVAGTDGTLLAFAEGRRDGPGDAGAIDLVLRRSLDGGGTWGPLQPVSPGHGDAVGNPCPVVDPATGDVVLLTTRTSASATEDRILRGEVPPEHGRRVWLQRSADNGSSWTPPVDITAQVKRPHWRWYATGPGHGVALTKGPHAGRLVAPANHSGAGYGGHLLLSDDGGHTWRIGAEEPSAPGARVQANETTAAELPDGRLYLNTRNQGGTASASRAQTISSTGGASFDHPYTPVSALVAPVVQGSVASVTSLGLVFAGPGDPARRRALTLRVSPDAGQSWAPWRVVWPGPAAYSDLIDLGGQIDPGGGVGVLFEAGADQPYERIDFARVPLQGDDGAVLQG